MRLVEKFVGQKGLFGYLGVLLGLLGAIWLVRVLNVVDFYLTIGASGAEIIRFMLFLIPTIFANVAAPALLISLLLLYSGLLNSREYYVLTGAGISPLLLFRPVLYLIAGVTIILAVVNLYVAPLASQTLRIERDALQTRLSVGLIREGVFTDLGRGVTVYAEDKDEQGRITNILIFDDRNPQTETVYIAKVARIYRTQSENALVLESGRLFSREKGNGRQRVVHFDSYQFPVTMQSDDPFNLAQLSPSQMMFHQLLNPAALGITDPRRILRVEQRVYEQIGELFTPLVFALIALSFVTGGALNRAGYSLRVFLASVTAILFYAGVVSLSARIAEHGWPGGLSIVYPVSVVMLCAMIFIRRNRLLVPLSKS
jgi:lipopolysaccharide export system permease protein